MTDGTMLVERNGFITHVENVIQNAVRGAFPREWEENHITYSLLKDLVTECRLVEVHGFRRPFRIAWDGYKFNGADEERFGDVGVLVIFDSWEGEHLEGVGLLEAKRRYENKSEFTAIKQKQLKRIFRYAPHAQVLLYDYAATSEFMDNSPDTVIYDDWRERHVAFVEESHAICVPMNTVIQLQGNTTSLYKFGIPLSVQLCSRYLRGFDLDFSKAALDAAKGYSSRFGPPAALLVAHVSTTEETQEQRGEIGLNLDRLLPINIPQQ
jgi:hypothetical protein